MRMLSKVSKILLYKAINQGFFKYSLLLYMAMVSCYFPCVTSILFEPSNIFLRSAVIITHLIYTSLEFFKKEIRGDHHKYFQIVYWLKIVMYFKTCKQTRKTLYICSFIETSCMTRHRPTGDLTSFS